jgi:ribonuclease HI
MIRLIIVSDGGSKGNGAPDAFAYGSYTVSCVEAGTHKHESLIFESGMTNNEAEYLTLITAIRDIKDAFEHVGFNVKRDMEFLIKVDSQLIIGQLKKGWKVKAHNLKLMAAEAGRLIDAFGKVAFEQISGQEMKSILGH